MAWIGRTEGYLPTVGIIHWGMVVCVYNIGYIAFLMRVPDAEAPAGGAGLVFFLLFVTQLNDVAQYCWGKAFGRTKITPNVSPNKTWEGAIGGIVSSSIFAAIASATFFPELHYKVSIPLAIFMTVIGILGDLSESAMKRGAGAKDAANILPGHGGLLDRLDSLLFNAPILYYFARFYF
jgi:phosphatidate cytidylyltransferase